VTPQITNPPYVTEPSVRQVNEEPAGMYTFIGPVVPLYRVDPIVM